MNIKEIEKIISRFENSNLEALEITNKDFQIKCKKTVYAKKNISIHEEREEEGRVLQNKEVVDKEESNIKIIKSPIVGTFYRAPSPDANVYVEIGQSVKKGQTLCIIEAMKIMNELESEEECKILEILVDRGQLVEFEQPLFKVEIL